MNVPTVFDGLTQFRPSETAMRGLVVPMAGDPPPGAEAFVESLATPALKVLAWLYLDELERTHDLCQSMDDPFGAHLHAVVHRRAGDPEGARLTGDIQAGDRSEDAVERQRSEWSALAARCAENL